jgi:hypothetical protein
MKEESEGGIAAGGEEESLKMAKGLGGINMKVISA